RPRGRPARPRRSPCTRRLVRGRGAASRSRRGRRSCRGIRAAPCRYARGFARSAGRRCDRSPPRRSRTRARRRRRVAATAGARWWECPREPPPDDLRARDNCTPSAYLQPAGGGIAATGAAVAAGALVFGAARLAAAPAEPAVAVGVAVSVDVIPRSRAESEADAMEVVEAYVGRTRRLVERGADVVASLEKLVGVTPAYAAAPAPARS